MFSLSVVCTLNTQLKLLLFKRYTVLGRMVNGNFVLTPTVACSTTKMAVNNWMCARCFVDCLCSGSCVGVC